MQGQAAYLREDQRSRTRRLADAFRQEKIRMNLFYSVSLSGYYSSDYGNDRNMVLDLLDNSTVY